MPAEIIDLVSSDSPPEITTSPVIPVQREFPIQNTNVVDFSDEIDIFPVSKRRRVSPGLLSVAKDHDVRISSEKQSGTTGSRGEAIKSFSPIDDDDIIAFPSSSPALPIRSGRSQLAGEAKEKPQQTSRAYDFLDISSEDDSSTTLPASTLQFSSRTAALLAELDGNRVAGRKASRDGKRLGGNDRFGAARYSTARRPAAPPSSIEEFSSQPRPAPAEAKASRRGKMSTPEREERDRLKASAKEAAKAQKAVERAAAKEAKAKEKQLAQDLAEVNRARHDKKVSVTEMIVRIPASLREEGNLVALAETVLGDLNVEVEMDESQDSSPPSGTCYSNVITWKRKHRARFDEEARHWVPLPRMEIKAETSHALFVTTAKQFVQMVQFDAQGTASGTDTTAPQPVEDYSRACGLGAHVEAIKTRWPGHRIAFLIEGLETYLRKSRVARNRSYQAAVRAQAQSETENGTGTTQRRKKNGKNAETPITVDDDAIEDALLDLQVEHGCLIHHATAAPETAEWIGQFTQLISTIPYRAIANRAEASFCMDVGQVKTGDDKGDTYVKMLQEIVRVTPPVAYGIAAQFPSVVGLVAAMRRDGPLFCQDLKKCSNKNGTFTDARIGPALSRRLYKIFMGRDPDSMDV